MNQDLQKLLRTEIHIRVEVVGPHRDKIRAALLEGLTQHGFSVVGPGGDLNEFEVLEGESESEDVLVKGRIEFQPVPNPQFKFVRWIAQFELIDRYTGKVFGGLIQSGREGHLTMSEAENRATRALQKEMTEELTTRLVGFIYGEEE